MGFSKFNFHAKIFAGVQSQGFSDPTPIQAESIPPILAGRDVVGLAQTGTGKTAAFVLPMLQRLLQGPRKGLRALIIAPTRELTEQTHRVIGQLGRDTRLRSASIYGGVNIQPQISTLRRGVDIVSACPGRLLDHIQRGTIDVSGIELLVLDEADHMFDMGFLPDIKRILKCLPANRQTLLFSATMPGDIRVLADKILRDPVRVQIGRTAPVDTVSHSFYPVGMDDKTALLKNLLQTTDTGPVLVFARTKIRTKRLAHQLERFGFEAAALHGNLSQNQRQQALAGFKSGRYKILVATDVAARGIDVERVSHVINYDIPDTVDAYTHRIGRTGRALQTGDAFTFVTRSDAGPARSISRVLGDRLAHCALKEFSGPETAEQRPQPAQRPGRGPRKKVSNARTSTRFRPRRPRRSKPARPAA